MRGAWALEWTTWEPTEPGLYLRNNPPTSGIFIAWVVSIDGVMNLLTQEGTRRDRGNLKFWWYGPIPLAPGTSRILSYPTPARARMK